MLVNAIKTEKILPGQKTIFDVLDTSINILEEATIVAITSKIVSLCEGGDRVIPADKIDKIKLAQREAGYYLEPNSSKYNVMFTLYQDTLIPNAGIDESNTGGNHVLWPKNPQKTANAIRDYLKKRFSLSGVGVVITDSTCTPLRWGTTGIAIAHSGFSALNSYIGKPDIFGRKLQMSQANIAGDLAATAVMIMGEGSEQTPIALISDASFVQFQDRNPTQKELNFLKITPEDDLFAPFLNAVYWHSGKRQDSKL
jgi:putative folate metabolism gamma-glutamate ligase